MSLLTDASRIITTASNSRIHMRLRISCRQQQIVLVSGDGVNDRLTAAVPAPRTRTFSSTREEMLKVRLRRKFEMPAGWAMEFSVQVHHRLLQLPRQMMNFSAIQALAAERVETIPLRQEMLDACRDTRGQLCRTRPVRAAQLRRPWAVHAACIRYSISGPPRPLSFMAACQ